MEDKEYIKIEGKQLQVEPIHRYESSFHNQRDIQMQDNLKLSPVRRTFVKKKTMDVNLNDLSKIPLKKKTYRSSLG